jgi:hypothetical protein
MKCLVVKQPWIGMELDGYKVWEMRSRPYKYQGKIGLIEQGTGLVVGEAYFAGCIDFFDIEYLSRFYEQHRIRDISVLKKWHVALVLTDVKRYETPIQYSHPPGAVTWVNVPTLM